MSRRIRLQSWKFTFLQKIYLNYPWFFVSFLKFILQEWSWNKKDLNEVTAASFFVLFFAAGSWEKDTENVAAVMSLRLTSLRSFLFRVDFRESHLAIKHKPNYQTSNSRQKFFDVVTISKEKRPGCLCFFQIESKQQTSANIWQTVGV